MHAKTDSDVTSFDTSPPRSPKRPLYYVQSPSRDSHDGTGCGGDKSPSMPAATPPAGNSPMESPSHPSSYAHHSRESSSSRVSCAYNNNSAAASGRKGNPKSNDRGWPECKVIEEEGGYADFYHQRKGLSRRTQFFFAIVAFVLIFTVFCLIIWAASSPYKPQLSVKSLTVHNFYFGEGSDLTGVPTKMLTVNCSMRMTVHNPASFFGIHVSSKPVNFMFSEIAVATGELKKYHQPRKSTKTVHVNLQGSKVPLYGAGASLASMDDGKIPMTLVFEVKSRGNVVGKLVTSKHTRHVSCSVLVDSHNNNPIKLKENECRYF